MSRLRDALQAGEFAVTAEIAPPHGTDLAGMLRAVEVLGPSCHAINVTDNQGATLHVSSLAASKAVLDAGAEPVFQVTCRDRNRLALQSELLSAWTLGLENVLVLTGDDPRGGDHPESKGVFDLDSTQLISATVGLNEGIDMAGQELDGATDLYVGAAVFPEARPWGVQLDRALAKVEAGARFMQTQAIFDFETLASAVDDLRPSGVKVLAGILLLKSPGVIDFINNRLAGLMIPEHVAERIRNAEDPLEESIVLATEQVRAARQIADGVHIMPLGKDEVVARILADAGV